MSDGAARVSYKVTIYSEVVVDDLEALQEWVVAHLDSRYTVQWVQDEDSDVSERAIVRTGDEGWLLLDSPKDMLWLAAEFAIRSIDGLEEQGNNWDVILETSEGAEFDSTYTVTIEADVVLADLDKLEAWNTSHLLPGFTTGGPDPPGVDTGIFLDGDYPSMFVDPDAMMWIASRFALGAVPGLLEVSYDCNAVDSGPT